jgi:hypothetical protein
MLAERERDNDTVVNRRQLKARMARNVGHWRVFDTLKPCARGWGLFQTTPSHPQ